MKRTALKVGIRTVVGRKVKNLRKEGLLPGTIYGKAVKSVSIQIPLKEFETVYKEAGETGLVDITLDGEAGKPVLIKNVQLDPKHSTPVHVDFHQVNLSEKIHAKVPVEAVGEPKAVADKIGILEMPLSEVEVEALPTDLPEKIDVDVTALAAIDEQITVADVKVPTGVVILTDATQILFKIGSLITKEAEELAKAEEAAAAAAAAQAGTAEGAAPAEGEKVAEGGAPAAEGEKAAEAPKAEGKPEEKKE